MSSLLRRLLPLAAVLTACIAFAACGDDDGGNGRGGGSSDDPVLRVGQPPFSAITVSNPFNSNLTTQFSFIYPQLVTYGPDGGIIGDLAESWEPSEDGRTWTFKLQGDGEWSDGKPVTAADVEWSIDTYVKYKEGASAGFIGYTIPTATGAKAIDNTTVSVSFEEPSSTAISGLAALFILPKHVWEPHATGEGGKNLNAFENPVPIVSGGPYVWTKFEEGSFSYFERNDGYYGEKPKIKAFGIQIFTDEDAMLAALESGQIDAVDYLSPANLEAAADAGATTDSAKATTIDLMAINSTQNEGTKHPELKDVEVREALDLAIDRDQMVDLVYNGQAEPGNVIIPAAATNWIDPELEPLPFDIDRANEILDSKGFERGDDGIRVADGNKMSYELIFPAYMRGPGDREFEIIKAGWKQIGVEVRKKGLDPDAARAAVRAPDGKYLNFAMSIGNDIPFPDPSGILSGPLCSQINAGNGSGHCNPEYDELWEAQEAAIDEDERRQIVFEMQRYLRDTHAVVPLVYPNWSYAHSPEWTGFVNGSTSGWFGGAMAKIEKAN